MVDVSIELPEKKTTSFLALGVILYIASVYLNNIQGQYGGGVLMAIALLAQVLNWLIYWSKVR